MNKYAVKCYNCADNGMLTSIPAGAGFEVFVNGGKRYLCSDCKRQVYQLLPYHGNANRGSAEYIKGTQKIGDIEKYYVGVELEGLSIGNSDLTIRYYLYRFFNAKFESDCTVDFEFPTERMSGLKSLERALAYFEKHNAMDIFNNDSCGAHIHVTLTQPIRYIRNMYHSIFLPLNNYIVSLGMEKRIEYFGSDFRYYAKAINADSNAENHANIFNTQHSHTLEFRLPRITSKKQYMQVVKFWRECVAEINNTELTIDYTPETRAKRKAECDVLAIELVKIAKKYFK